MLSRRATNRPSPPPAAAAAAALAPPATTVGGVNVAAVGRLPTTLRTRQSGAPSAVGMSSRSVTAIAAAGRGGTAATPGISCATGCCSRGRRDAGLLEAAQATPPPTAVVEGNTWPPTAGSGRLLTGVLLVLPPLVLLVLPPPPPSHCNLRPFPTTVGDLAAQTSEPLLLPLPLARPPESALSRTEHEGAVGDGDGTVYKNPHVPEGLSWQASDSAV